MVYHDVYGEISEPEETRFQYRVGEKITVNHHGNEFKCIKIEEVEGKILQHFKQAKRIYTYDY